MIYEQLGKDVGSLVDEKNKAYGDSFAQCGEFLKLLWPAGVPSAEYGDMLAVVRIFDKLKRIATNKDFGGESPFRDIAGYALLGLASANAQHLSNPPDGCRCELCVVRGYTKSLGSGRL